MVRKSGRTNIHRLPSVWLRTQMQTHTSSSHAAKGVRSDGVTGVYCALSHICNRLTVASSDHATGRAWGWFLVGHTRRTRHPIQFNCMVTDLRDTL